MHVVMSEGDDTRLQFRIHSIKNKMKRQEAYLKFRRRKETAIRKARKRRRRQLEYLGDNAPPKKVPRTIENTCEIDPTVVDPNDQDVQEDIAEDEMASYFEGREPRVLLTTSSRPSRGLLAFGSCLCTIFSNCEHYGRRDYTIKEILEYSTSRDYTDLILLNETGRRQIYYKADMFLVHLPRGPTVHFGIRKVVMPHDIKGHGRLSLNPCELILNNFKTRLGITVGRMLACLFPQNPDFRARHVATFHNQRDFIFFRHHRYIFESNKDADDARKRSSPVLARLQELGPRFVLKLRSLQLGTLDRLHGEYLFLPKKELLKSKRRFFL